jgi:Tfp pilus assembly protein PilF
MAGRTRAPSQGTLVERYECAQKLFDAHDYICAAREFAEIIAEEPSNLAARLWLGRAYYHSAQLTRAEATLREVIERDPTEAYAHLMLGRTLQRQSRHPDTIGSLRVAAALTDQYR